MPSEEKAFELELHQSSAELFLSDRLVMALDHWVDLLWANLLGLGPRIWGMAVGRCTYVWHMSGSVRCRIKVQGGYGGLLDGHRGGHVISCHGTLNNWTKFFE